MNRLTKPLLLFPSLLIMTFPAGAATWNEWRIVSEFHTDLGVNYQQAADTWNTVMDRGEFGGSGEILPPQSTILLVNPEAIRTVPEGVPPGFSFLGQPGDTYYLLPTVERPRVLYLGFNAYGVPNGVFTGGFGGEIAIELAEFAGTGPFFLYTASPAGPQMFMDSTGMEPPFGNVKESSGGHSHYNWVFLRRGIHILGLRTSGERVADGIVSSSEPIPFFFLVDPRPVDWWLLHHFREEALSPAATLESDASGDGLPNLLAYAFGYSPDGKAFGRLPHVETVEANGQHYPGLVFRKAAGEEGRDDRSDLVFRPQVSGDLLNWYDLDDAAAVWEELGPDEDGTPRIRVRETTPVAENTRRFFRLQVELIP